MSRPQLSDLFRHFVGLGIWRYTVVTACVSIGPALMLAWAATVLGAWLLHISPDQLGPHRAEADFTPLAVFAATVLAPLAESVLALGAARFLLNSWPHRSMASHACCIALVAGGLHGLIAPLWFFPTAWSFYVFLLAWFVWHRTGARGAFLALLMPHIYQNSLAYAVILVTR